MSIDVQKSLGYEDRLEHLRRKKLEQTRLKLDKLGYVDEDDYGSVLPPEDFRWSPRPTHPSGSWHGVKAWGENYRDLMENHPVYVDPMDALAGRCMFFLNRMRPERWPAELDYSHLVPEQEKYGLIPGIGFDAHFAPDFRIGLQLGWGGLLQKVRHFRKTHRLQKNDPQKEEFFQAEENVILGVQNLIGRTVQAIRKIMAAEQRPELRENLAQMADVNTHLIENPPRTFIEACQWIAWFNIASRTYDRDGAGGQLDVLLFPYYERDMQAGLIDEETAEFYLACLLLNDTQYYQIGGPDANGRDQTNRLSFLILEAAHRLRSTCNLTIRVHDGLDEELFRLGVRYLLEDRKGWPRFSGDKALVEGFMRNGYTAELARERIAVGCHWMALPGREYTMNDVVKINIAKVFTVAFEEMMDDQIPGRENRQPCVAFLWTLFEEHLRRAVRCTARGIDFHLDHMHLNEPELMLNLLCHGPIERGLNVTNGGVDYYNMCVDGAGLATVADSFAALEQRIEHDKVLLWPEINTHLKHNFSDTDGPRVRMMMKTAPRYGQGGSLSDQWAQRISRLFTDLVKESPTPGGRNMIPGWFSWADTVRLGQNLSATPNGRKVGEPISHGANPDPGFRNDGAATAMAKAIAAIQPGYGNTAPMQLELDPGIARLDDAVDKIGALIKTHFQLGGTLLNISIVDAEKIAQAHRDPSKFPDLIVRVTGFVAYFANLSPEFRQLVVDRVIREG